VVPDGRLAAAGTHRSRHAGARIRTAAGARGGAVAVKNGYALVAAAIGPYHEFSPDFGTGHPSGVNLQLAMDMGKYVNSFKWRTEQPA
jgi:hypothetical protein